MLRKLLTFFDQNAYRREVAQYTPILRHINALEPHFRQMSEAALRNCSDQFKQRLQKGEELEELLPEAFAAVREAAWRTISLRHYDVQIIGGIVLQHGAIAELRTGEGKTLAATLPLYLTALQGQGAHLVTVNDYLARRDARWMGPVYYALGISVGVLQADEPGSLERLGYLYDPRKTATEERFNLLRSASRSEAYAADITYGTNSEFGFDYLRDNLVRQAAEKSQHGHHFAIIDEVDNILIDEARTPLIISGENRSEIEWYDRMAGVVSKLRAHEVEINPREQVVSLLPGGEKHVSAILGVALVDPRHPEEASQEQRHIIGHLEQALRARFLYQRDREYVVQDGHVVIVDEFTGRMMPGRRWTDGLHQAVEAKEGLEVQSESITYATISLQNYFRLYDKLAGMTGTALTAAAEFEKIYKLQVHPIPTHVEYQALNKDDELVEREGREPEGQAFTFYARRDDTSGTPQFWKRVDYPDVLYLNAEAKRRAIVWEILSYHTRGRPLLVGTTSVADSEELARYLTAPMLSRLCQARLLRKGWLQAFPDLYPDLPVEELRFLEAPLGLVNPAQLERLFARLKLEADPLANLPALGEMLDLPPEFLPRLEAALGEGIANTILNARYHYEESQIIAGAGSYGSVVIATNMAGRGVDIKLGGELAEEVLMSVNRLLEGSGAGEPYAMTLAERRQALKGLTAEQMTSYQAEAGFFSKYVDDMERVKKLGGLHVIGCTRHEARRIDHQLRGRAARQGDPGSSRFFVSMEDDLMVRFGSLEGEAFLEQEDLRGGDTLLPSPGEPGRRVIEIAQKRVEDENFEIRQHLLDYDDVINAQRLAIYNQRDRILAKPDLSSDMAEMLEAELEARRERYLEGEEAELWQFVAAIGRLQPNLRRADGSLYPSWPLQVIHQRVMENLREQTSSVQAQTALLTLSEQALSAERRFIEGEAERQCEAVLTEMQAAVTERMEAVETCLDSLDTRNMRRRPTAAVKALSEAAGMAVQLSPESLEALADEPRLAAMQVLDQIEASLLQSAVERVVAVVERVLGQPLVLDPAAPMPASPYDLPGWIAAAVQKYFERRRERLTSPLGELSKELEEELGELELPLSERDSLKMLEMMQVKSNEATEEGRRSEAAGDQAAEGPPALPFLMATTAARLSYTFLAAELLSDLPAEEIADQALEHLLQAQQTLAEDLGAGTLNEYYRQLLLENIDYRWVEYLTSLEELRYEVRLEGMAHNDPLVVYKSKASNAYEELLKTLRVGAVALMFQPLAASRPKGSAEAGESEKPAPRLTYLKLG